MDVSRGDIIRVFLDGSMGSEIANHGDSPRPCVVVQNDRGNGVRPVTIVAPLHDAAAGYRGYPEQVFIPGDELRYEGGKDSVVECGQIRTIDSLRIQSDGVIATLQPERLAEVDAALCASLGLNGRARKSS